MTDEQAISSAPEVASPVVSAPVEAASVQSPVVEAPVSAPVEAKTEAEPAIVAESAPQVAETVLGKTDAAVTEVKTESAQVSAETQPEGEKKEEVSQSDEPAPLPSYEPWKFPENTSVDEAQIAEVNRMFGEFEQMTKADHALVQKFGQQMIDRHIAGIQSAVDQLTAAYQKAWKDQTQQWHDAFIKDPEIGGQKKDVSAAAANEFIRRHGGTYEQQTELRNILEKTGLGNHPSIIRTFAKATANLAEGKIVPAGMPPAAPSTRKTRFYGKKS